MNTKRILGVLVAVFALIAGSTSFSADFVPNNAPFVINMGSLNLWDPNWIIAKATVEVANATVAGTTATRIAAGAAVVYAFITILLILGQRNSRLDDKFPCIIVRSLPMPIVKKDGSPG